MTSIHDIPSEVLSHIFLFHYASSRRRFTLIKPTLANSAIPAPFNTTSICVCRHWRDVVHDTPQLWEYIPLHLPVDDVHRRLTRSKGFFINISCDAGPSNIGLRNPGDLSFNFASAITHAARWKTLHLKGDFTTLHLPRNIYLPELEHVVVAWKNNVRASAVSIFQTPRLRTAAFTETSPHLHRFSLTNLTALLIDSSTEYSFHDLRPVLASITALQTLVVRQPILPVLDSAVEPITIPTLRTLEIDIGSAPSHEFPKNVCRAIHAPNLENLHLLELSSSETCELLSSISASTFPRLMLLRLSPYTQTSLRSIRVFEVLSAPTHLALGGAGLFGALERLTSHIDVLPDVETLSVDCPTHRDPRNEPIYPKNCSLEEFEEVLAFVRARSRIKKLRFFHGCMATHPLVMGRLERLLIEIRPPFEYRLWP